MSNDMFSPSPTTSLAQHDLKAWLVISAAVFALAVLPILLMVCCYCHRDKRSEKGPGFWDNSSESETEEKSPIKSAKKQKGSIIPSSP